MRFAAYIIKVNEVRQVSVNMCRFLGKIKLLRRLLQELSLALLPKQLLLRSIEPRLTFKVQFAICIRSNKAVTIESVELCFLSPGIYVYIF